jgi:4-hydroxy-4-methyl-2-oxoglutarate aldolase
MPTRLVQRAAKRLPKATIDAWRKVPSAVAADKQLNGRCHADARIRPIRPFAPGAVLVGSAVTAWCEPADYGPVHHAIAVAKPGDMIVVAAGGPARCRHDRRAAERRRAAQGHRRGPSRWRRA